MRNFNDTAQALINLAFLVEVPNDLQGKVDSKVQDMIDRAKSKPYGNLPFHARIILALIAVETKHTPTRLHKAYHEHLCRLAGVRSNFAGRYIDLVVG